MGKLVAVEGPDLVGKSTLVQHLDLQLRERQFKVENFRFPPDERPREVDHLYDVFTKTADPLKRQLTLVEMFNAYGPKILGALRGSDIVLIDRYMLSPLVACKALGIDLKPIQEAMRSAIIPPDVTVIYTGLPFAVPPGETPERRAFRDEVSRLFNSTFPEYRYPVIRVTNEAAHVGKFDAFVTHLADQVLGFLRLPLRKEPVASAR